MIYFNLLWNTDQYLMKTSSLIWLKFWPQIPVHFYIRKFYIIFTSESIKVFKWCMSVSEHCVLPGQIFLKIRGNLLDCFLAQGAGAAPPVKETMVFMFLSVTEKSHLSSSANLWLKSSQYTDMYKLTVISAIILYIHTNYNTWFQMHFLTPKQL